ncbi:methyltransferase domain-containing protein [Microbacteriaceae bacterium K1510]|nr:methyltransferase domain-containing protein [Microbacteriaceae bacterium K1510]
MPRYDSEAQLAAIELAWTLQSGGTVTEEQAGILRGFTGWGGLAPAFAVAPTGRWLTAADRIDAALPAEAFEAARDQVDTSYFTPEAVAGAVFELLRGTGFTGGNVLEPGCGSGAFMSSAPADLPIHWTGVEIDPTSARIAQLLHPDAEIHESRLQSTVLRDEYFDAVIGNVPFSSSTVYDSRLRRSLSLHNYFASRAIAALRPGGYAILIISRHSMDSQSGIGELLEESGVASLIGAVRLPSGAFASAGTDAVTDILAIRRNDELAQPMWPAAPDFERHDARWDTYRHQMVDPTVDHRMTVTEPARPGLTITDAPAVSRYWGENPAHVAGVMVATGYPPAPLAVASTQPDDDIARAVASLTSKLVPIGRDIDVTHIGDVVLQDAAGRKEGSFHDDSDGLVRIRGGKAEPVRPNAELKTLIELRDLAVELLAQETNPQIPDAQIAVLRARTLSAYTSYVARFGHLNRGSLVEGRADEETGLPSLSWRRPAMGGFRRDPDAALVMALEVFDQDTGEAGPAPILLHRVNRAPDPVVRVDTPAEAVAVSLGETGYLSVERIAGLLGITEGQVPDALGDLAYEDGNRWVAAGEYLSGDLRAKLRHAERAGVERNIDALRAALPPRLGPLEIKMGLGSPFVSTADVSAFLSEEMGVRYPTVTRSELQGVWEVNDGYASASAQIAYGTPDAQVTWLVECALNARAPEVHDREYSVERHAYVQVRNAQKSAAASEKLELIRDRFSTWVWEDAARAERICDDYNERLNCHVTRKYDGSGLTFPGLHSDFTPWPHQRAAVERITSSPRALLAHPVGAGKSAEMVMAARTLRQFGLARKPLIVVPNHLLDQMAREAQQTFPTGRFLIATKDDLARDERRVFAARCATGDWDAVIMTHSAFTAIPVHPESETRWLAAQKHRLRLALSASGSGQKEKGPKAIARAIRALEARILKLREGIGDLGNIWFEQLGVDHLMIDEAHLFRRLSTDSASRDNGMGSGSSKRATDLLVKVETLAARRPEGAPVVALFTGTPWSNTLAETWVWQRFLQPEILERIGLLAFDSWVSAFIRFETNIEVSPDGSTFRMQRRPVGVVNAPELKTMLAQVADIVDPAVLGLPRPAVTTRTLSVEPTPGQRRFVEELAARADAIHDRRPGQREARGGHVTDDNMLLVCNDGRKVALDPRLVGLPETSQAMLTIADAIVAAHREQKDRTFGNHPAPGAFQLAFFDLGTPKPGDTSTYGRLRRALVDRGMDPRRIRFAHDATTDKARAALFAACRDGEVDLLIGSTAKVGMGTNVQTRLTHLWHLDAPWQPSSVVQRDGRGDRPGNLAGHLTITRVVTEGTFDAFMWQAIERKSRSFDALYATGATAREIEDVSAASISYGELKALASGNPLLLEQATVRAEVKRLQLMRAVHQQSARKARADAAEFAHRAEQLTTRSENARDAAAASTARTPDDDARLRAQVIETIAALRGGGQPGRPIRFRSTRGLGLSMTPLAGTGLQLQVMFGYRNVTSGIITPREMRRGTPAVAEIIVNEVNALIDSLPANAEEWISSAHLLQVNAESSAAAAAAGDMFPDQAELDGALQRLALIDAAIADSVTVRATEQAA